jgi:HPt (histidine-containing phosphotransfer) domain-containing protein
VSDKPLYSTLKDDPEMVELIEYFLDQMDHRVEVMTNAWRNAEREDLRTLAHQLKGAAAGFGYQCITDAARELEQGLNQNEADLSSLSEQVEALVQLCRQAAAARTAE